MFGNHYYHQKIRKTTAIFGTLFNNINIVRTTSAGVILNEEQVPIAFGPREKFLERLDARPELDSAEPVVALKLPRMSFEIVGLVYDSARSVNKNASCSLVTPEGTDTERVKFYSGAPYKISYQLSIMAKTNDDALQVVEQILPNFKPSFTVRINPFTDFPAVEEDIKFTITSVAINDTYEGSLTDRRVIIYTLDFDAEIYMNSSLNSGSNIIKTVFVNFKDYDDSTQILEIETVVDPADTDKETWEAADEPVTVTYTYSVDE